MSAGWERGLVHLLLPLALVGLKLLYDYLAPPNTKPRYAPDAEDAPDEPIDWADWEETLFVLTRDAVDAFAAEHPDERFYGLALDCDPQSGEVLIGLNTREALSAAAADMAAHDPAVSVDALAWDVGCWKYIAINHDDEAWYAWDDVRFTMGEAEGALLHARDMDARDDLHQAFLGMTAAVGLRMQAQAARPRLPATPDFRVLAVGRNESPEAGFARMARLAEGEAVPA